MIPLVFSSVCSVTRLGFQPRAARAYDFVSRPHNEWVFSCPTHSYILVSHGG